VPSELGFMNFLLMKLKKITFVPLLKRLLRRSAPTNDSLISVPYGHEIPPSGTNDRFTQLARYQLICQYQIKQLQILS